MCFLHRKGVCVQEAHCFWQPVTVHAACVNRWEVTNVITFGLSGSSSSQECCVCKPTTGLLHTLAVIYDALQIKWCSTPHTHSKNDPRSRVISLSPSVSSAHIHISSSKWSHLLSHKIRSSAQIWLVFSRSSSQFLLPLFHVQYSQMFLNVVF